MKFLSLVSLLFQSISVEPATFFLSGGFSVFSVLFSTGMYWKVCEQVYGTDPSVQCTSERGSALAPSVEAHVQRELATWNIYSSVAQILPLVIIGPIYGAIGDRYGRKGNLMVSLGGMTLFALLHVVQLSVVSLPMYVYPLAGFFISLTGFIGTALTSCFAYLADETKDNDLLTYRMTFLTVTSGCSDVIFGLVVASLTAVLSFAEAMMLPMVLWCCAFFYSLIFLRQIPPKQMQLANQSGKGAATVVASTNENQDQNHVELLTNGRTPACTSSSVAENCNTKTTDFTCSDALGIFKELVQNTVEAVTKRRDGRKRLYIWITVFDFLILNGCQMGMGVVLGLFLMHSPISWGPTEIAYYNVFNSIVQLAGTLIGTFIMKRVLRLHETCMLIVTMVSAIAKCTLIAFSFHGSMLYLASLLGLVSNLTFPICKSLTAQFVDRDEIGKIFALYQIATDLSIVFAFGGFSTLYAMVVDFYPGAVFLLIALLASVGLLPLIFVHIDFKRYRQLQKCAKAASINADDSSELPHNYIT